MKSRQASLSTSLGHRQPEPGWRRQVLSEHGCELWTGAVSSVVEMEVLSETTSDDHERGIFHS